MSSISARFQRRRSGYVCGAELTETISLLRGDRSSMKSVRISVVVFALVFGGALSGMFVSPFLPASQFKEETKITLRVGVGLLTTMFSMLLGLQLSSGRTSFDAQEQDVAALASKVVMLDRVLFHYGPEAQEARESLRTNIINLLDRVWPKEPKQTSTWAPDSEGGVGVYNRIQKLSPADEDQRSDKGLALRMAIELGQLRWMSASRIRSSTAIPLMIVETSWAIIIFTGFGLLAPRNAMIIGGLAICASAVSGGFFLIVEMNTPFSGLLHASSAPLREALKHLAR